ncbi:hypothetical protein ACH4MG_27130 [Streptomyces sp. NPDC017454]|uniref:hypothetical protein n=1 Tax=Streptomyces sp. NPDC017454 TaxID=3364997 RepID=UPI003797FAE3
MNDYLPAVLAWLAATAGIAVVWHGRHTTTPRPKPASAKTDQPQAAIIEIVEKGRSTTDTASGSIIVPNDVRINGQSILVPRDAPVVVHEMAVDDSTVAHVTLTLFARRVSIAAEGDL